MTPNESPPSPGTQPADAVEARVLDSLDRLRIQTKMMVEDYDPASATPTTPVYRTQLLTTRPDGTPQPKMQLQLWAGAAMEVTIDGVTHSLPASRDGAPTFTTDELGQLTLTYSASDISSPVLNASGPGLGVFSSVPDFQVVRTLSTVQGPDLGPTRAKDYRGRPILLETYRNQESQTALADAIRNTVGRRGPSAALSAFLAGENMAPLVGAAGGQSIRPNEILHWTLDLGDEAVFIPSETEVLSATSARAEAQFGALRDFTNFLGDVVEGGERVANAAARWGRDSIEFLIQTGEAAYRFTVRTLKDAVAVLRGILEAVVEAIEQVVEWLSFLFDWRDIVRTAEAMNDLVSGRLEAVRRQLDSALDLAIASTESFFQARENDVERLLGQLGDSHQETFGTAVRGVEPLSGGGESAGVQVRWLMSRSGISAASGSAGELFPQGAVGDAVGAAQAQLFDRVQSFAQEARTMVESDPATRGLPEQFQKTLDDLVAFVQDFAALDSASLQDLLQVFGDLAVLAMKAASAVASLFLNLLKDLIDAVIGVFTSPIDIPFLSPLFKFLTGNDLTVVRLGALLVAVPTTILYKAIFGRSPVSLLEEPLAALTVPRWLTLGLSISFVLRSLTEPVADLGVTGALGLGANVAVTAVQWGLGAAAVGDQGSELARTLLLLLGLFPLIVGGSLLNLPAATRMSYSRGIGPFVTSAYGILLLIVTGVLAGLEGGVYLRSVGARVAAAVPLAAKAVLRLPIQVSTLIVLGLDFAGFELAAALTRNQSDDGRTPLAVAV